MPVFTLSGNHDMYCRRRRLLRAAADAERAADPPAGKFFLPAQHLFLWQFVAMDTGLHDNDPFNVDTVLTFLEKDEQQWLVARIAEFGGKTILLSHHQLFSALAQIGPLTATCPARAMSAWLKAAAITILACHILQESKAEVRH